MQTLHLSAIHQYAVLFAAQVTQQFYARHTVATGEQILHLSPVAQVNYFILKNLFSIWQKEREKIQSPYFDYTHPEVNTALQNFLNLLSRHIAVKPENLKELIEKAVEQTFYLALEPVRFIEQELSNIPPNTLNIHKLKEINRYIKINKSWAEELLKQVESFGEQPIPAAHVIATAQSLVYLSQVNLEELIAQFASVQPLSLSDITVQPETKPVASYEPIPIEMPVLDYFQDLLNQNENKTPSLSATTPSPEKQSAHLSPELSSYLAEKPSFQMPAIDEELKTLAHHFTQQQEKTTLHDKIREQQQNAPKQPTLNEIIGNQYKKIDSLKNAFSVNEKYSYIRDLFKEDNIAWSMALHELDHASSWQEAEQLVRQKYAPQYGWDFQHERVKAFMNALQRRFNP